jgi:hypothetical protein
MTTKDQERQAIEEIRKIVTSDSRWRASWSWQRKISEKTLRTV